MKRSLLPVAAALLLLPAACLLGCKPDAAIRQGAIVDAGAKPDTGGDAVNKPASSAPPLATVQPGIQQPTPTQPMPPRVR